MGDFPSLTSLDISRNNIKSLPNSLCNLSRLETLSLQYCGCHQVQFLCNLPSLRHVDVDLGQLISIRIHCLDEFSAAGTTISLIQRNRGAKNVIIISIDELRGSDLDITPSSVKSSPHEKDSQPLTSISISHFDDPDILNCLLSILCMQSLQNLKVANCCLTALPDSLGDLHSLTSLDISGNPLKILPSAILHMSTLKVLDVSNCSLTALPDSFRDLQSLTNLDISGNPLGTFPFTILHLSTLLKVLNLSNCYSSLTVLPDSIGDFPSLTSLDISRNNLKTMPNSLCNLSRLETMSLQYCGCHKVEFLSNLPSLRHVKVDLAQLISIRIHCLDEFSAAGTTISLIQRNRGAENVISIDDLRGSDLHIFTESSVKSCPSHGKDSQPLSSISISHFDDPDILNCLLSTLCTQNLQHLKVANCCLTALPDSLHYLHSLTSLDISGHPLKILPGAILHMSAIKVLDVSNCSLTALPDSLGDLQSLTNVDISGNPLKTLPFTISHLSTLKVLDVSNCSLTVLPDSIGNFSSLTSLDLSRNDIKILPNSISHLSTLEKLSMQYCGCHQVEFLLNLTSLRHVEVDVAQLICIRLSCLDKISAAGTSINLAKRTMFPSRMRTMFPSHMRTMFPSHMEPVNVAKLRGPVLDIDSLWHIDIFENYPSHTDIQPLTSLSISDVHVDLECIADVVFSIGSLKVLKLQSKCIRLQTLPETIQHLSNLTHLDLSNNDELSNLPKGLGELKMLQKLELSNCSLSTFLEPNAKRTQQLSNLTALDISNNILTTLSEGLTSLLSLTELNISCNHITDMMFPVSMAKLSSLQRLTIFHCGCYQMGFLSELKQLEYLKVDFWQLVSIQQQTAERLPDCVQIEVVYSGHKALLCNIIRNVPSNRIALEDLRHCVVKLQCCEEVLRLSPPGDFKYNGDIIKMDVSGGDINTYMYLGHDETLTLNISVIHTLQELIMTNLKANRVPWFNKKCSVQFPVNLTRLHISTCITIDNNHHFFQSICQQSALQELKMSDCSIQCVPEKIRLLVNLTHLDLSKNRIENLPDELCNITSLIWLSLQDNKLSILPERIGNLLSLEYLDVSYNKLASIPDSFKQLSSINELKLSQCGYCHLAFLNEFTEVKILQLDFWQLLSIPQHSLMQMHGLLKIAMSAATSADCAVTVDLESLKQGKLNFHNLNINNFSTPPPFFILGLGRSIVDHGYNIQVPPSLILDAGSSQAQVSTYFLDVVKYLDLSHNKLREIPEALSLLGNLIHLDISNNIIKALPGSLFSFQKLSSLQHLDLSHNKLEWIPETLYLLGNLIHLDISNNIITALPRGLVALKEIESFYVNRNKIVWESFIDLASYKKLKYVKFDLINYPFLDRLPSSWISVTVTLCDGQRNHIADIDWDIQTSQKPHKYFDFVVRCLQGRAPDAVMLSSSDMHTISPIVLALHVPQGSERVNSLLLSSNNMSEVPSDTFKLLNLRHLDLSKNNISLIPGDLWKLPNLSYVDISLNKIKKITEEISVANSLTVLLAQANELTELPQSISTLPLLEELCVFSNDINISQTQSVLSMMTLKQLKIDLANAVKCESHLTCNESLLMHCYYQGECVFAISAKIFFEHLTQRSMLLQGHDKQPSINLSGFGLVAFPGPIISQHLNVEAIDLSQNEIRDIPPEVSKLQQLQEIILSQNGIQYFPQYLHLCISLRHLDLYLNAIQNLPDDIEEMKELQYMNLSSNSLKRLPLSIGNLQQLEELVLEYNQIDQLPDSIGTLEKLSILRLSANCLRAVPCSLCNLVCLKQIDLSNNGLESIPEMIGTLKNLTSLDISGNSLSMLPSSICSCHSLETMKLSSNTLTQLPDAIDQLESLKMLQASMNRLSAIPSAICRLQHLQTFDVSVNNITELPEELGELSSLTVLNVGSNHLKELPESFTKLVNVTSVDISSNDLKAIPEEMFEFVKLIEFNISGNKIDTLPNTLCELQNLEYLSLEENNIRVLPTQFGKLHRLRQFGKEQIQDNPIEQPPIEVFEQGLEGVAAYFEELNLSKAVEVPRVKTLLLGEVAAGKTSLCNAIRLGKSKLTDITDRTAGIEVHPARLQDSIQVLMHDFGGHKIYHLTHQFFFSTAALYLIVVDLKAFKRSSFNAAVKYWLNVIKARLDTKPVLRIVATHIDLCDSEEVKEKAELIMKKMKQIENIEVGTLTKHLSDIDDALNRAGTPCSDWCDSLEGYDAQSLRKRRKFIEHLIDNRPIFPEHIDLVSCDLSLAGIKQLIENIVISCQDHRLFPRRILPKSWFELELAIKTLKQEGHLHYLSIDDVQKVAKEKANMTPTRLTRALKYLHDIGEIVHFSDSPQLSNSVFHKPQWLMDVFKLVYKPLDRFDERFASVSDADFDDMVEEFSSRGIVSERMIQCLWKEMNLSKQEESMLICLLQKFDLCFQMPTTENAVSHVYRFPWLLKESAPQEFRQCWKQKISCDEEVLMIVFQLQNYCPVGLFETLSVKLDKYVICRQDWRYGIMAFSKVGKNKILVQLEPKERSEEIVISVRTQSMDLKEAWEDMVLIINSTKELLQQWPGVLYCVRVVCPHCLKRGEDKPHRFSGAVLDKAPRGIVVCPKTMEKIDPRLIHPEISPAQWQQRRKRALEESGKSPAPEEIMVEKQPRYSEREPGNSVRNNSTVHTTHISKDCNAQSHADTANVWERFRSMSIEMQPGDEGNRLAAHLMESGLQLRPDVPKDGNCLFHAVSDQLVRTGSRPISPSQLRQDVVSYLRQYPYNGQGDHLRAFVPNEDWEGYLQEMSQNGVWGDHIVLQALASMLGRDIRIVSSIDADNYTTILTPMGNQQDITGPPLLLGHYAENHYASLDVCQRSAVLLVIDEYGTSKGGISTINLQLAQLLRRLGAVVYCTVLWVTKEDQEEARKDGVHLIEPSVQAEDTRKPSLDWLTFDHHIRYPNLPENVGYIVGHADITDKAAKKIKNSRYPQAKLFTFNHTIPEDTEHYKEGGKPLKAWEKEKELLKVADAADAVFSVGKRIYDHFETMYKGDKKPKTHHLFLPKPSKTFENTHVKPGGEQKVVLSIGRVKKVEQLKGHDLAARAIGKVAEVITNIRMRVRGINEDDYEASQRILEDNLQSGRLKPTLLPYGTQKDISDDMKTAHLVLMPSRSEPFGLVGLEALAAGIPVLISSQSGLADLIKELIKEEKCDPDLRHRIVETSVNVGDLEADAGKWAKEIEDTLRRNDEAFQKAALFKQQLQESMYWEESHQIFLQACGITNASSS